MLNAIGVSSVDELFAPIPESIRLKEKLNLPAPLDDLALQSHLEELADRNKTTSGYISFLGAGSYDHYVPPMVDFLASNPAFVTAYTPYQAEASQGALQLFYEYQTLICELTGMDVSNATMYEAGSALAEAVLMARDITAKSEIIVPQNIHPEYVEVLRTYISALPMSIIELPTSGGIVEIDRLESLISDRTSAVIVQQPNFFGLIEQLDKISEIVRKCSALFIVIFDPLASGLIKPPGRFDADIVVGEGQALGIPQSFGGPYLGFFATRDKYMRRIPGRLVGKTVDVEGKVAFCLTLQTREQHIRRERATSNICSNEGLLAIRSAIYLSAIGKTGLKQIANLCFQKSHYLFDKLTQIDGIEPLFPNKSFFKEFAIRLSKVSPEEVVRFAKKRKIFAGVELGRWFEEYRDSLLIAVTEKRTKSQLDCLVKVFEELSGK